MTALTEEQRVQRAHVWLMNEPKYCLFAGIMMLGNTEVRDDVPTAATNGRDTFYGRAFSAKQDEKKLRGLILHENMHKAFRHLTVWEPLWKQDRQLSNMACDYVINQMIVDGDPHGENVQLPDGGLINARFRGMDVLTVFNILKKEQDEQGNGGGKAGTGEGFDEHDWEGAQELTADEKESLAKEIDQALRQGAILAGKLKGGVPREISDMLEAKVDWRDVLRDYVTSVCAEKDMSTWRKPNRRWVDQGVYLPSMIGESVGRIVVGIDMSGSIGADEVGQFLGELMHICNAARPEGIDLLYWDTDVCQHEKYDMGSYEGLITSTKPKGGGGTDPACVAKYIKDHNIKAECAIILTDGYVSSWGTWSVPVLWGITTKRIVADVGVSVYVGD